MRREIDDQQAPARGDEARRLAQGAGRIIEVMQDLVDDHEVEAVPREGRSVDIALPQLDAGQARIVELRFFGGLDVEETAEVLSLSPRTVKREWQTARAWLQRRLAHGGAERS